MHSTIVAALAATGLLAVSVAGPSPPATAAAGEQSEDDEAREGEETCAAFEEVARELEASPNPYVGHAQDAELARELRLATEGSAAHVDLLIRSAARALVAGELDRAVSTARSARSLARAALGRGAEAFRKRERNARFVLAQAWLRQAEFENCISRHNRECCIFPLEGGGLHQRDEPAREALALFVELAREEPDDLSHLWLANLLAMAIDEHPEALPEDLRIPPEAFESELETARFTDVAPALGLDVFSLCGGSVLEDLDGDGRLDVVASDFDPRRPLAVFANDGEGGFEDRSAESGTSCQLGGLNVVAADYDDDGDADLLVLRGAWLAEHGRVRNSLLQNDGTGAFSDVTEEAGLAEPAYPTQAGAFGDLDGDGDLDLYVGNENAGRRNGERVRTPSQLFLNDGEGGFELTREAENLRFAKGVALGDADGDGDLDLYVSNKGRNRLYENDGAARFTDVAEERGVEKPIRSFATWFFDWNNDGRLDLFVTGYDAGVEDLAAHYLGRRDGATRPALFEGLGGGRFRDVAREVGLDRPFLPMGANFADVDGDGWLDVYLATGNPPWTTLMPNVLLLNQRGERFLDATRSAGLGHLQKGHGVSFGDVDDDGDTDLYHELGGFYRSDAFANALFENPGSGGRFLYVRLEGRRSNRAGYGARIEVRIEAEDGPRSIHRAVGSVSSFGSTPFRQEIGLGDARRILALEVVWPASGTRQRFEDVPLDACVKVVEGEDALVPVPLDPQRLGVR